MLITSGGVALTTATSVVRSDVELRKAVQRSVVTLGSFD